MPLFKAKHINVNNLTDTGVVGRVIVFDVDASKAGKGSLAIEINGGSVGCQILPRANDQYRASFTPLEAKSHVVQLKFNGRKLPKNPFKVDIHPEDRVIVSGSGLRRIPVDKPTSFTVRTVSLRKVNVSASITSPSDNHIETYVIDNDDGSSVVEYVPTQAGSYSIEVFCEGGAFSGNPLFSEAFDISAVTVKMVTSYTVGKTFGFDVDTTRAGDGALEVTILSGTNRKEGSCVNSHTVTLLEKGLHFVTFTPSTPHPTYACISFNSTELPQSPVRLDRQTSEPLNMPHPSSQTLPASGSRSQQPRPAYRTTSGSSHVSRDDSVVCNYETFRRDVTESAETAGTSGYTELYAGISRHEDDGSSAGGDCDNHDYTEPEDSPRDYENVQEERRDFKNVPEDLRRVLIKNH